MGDGGRRAAPRPLLTYRPDSRGSTATPRQRTGCPASRTDVSSSSSAGQPNTWTIIDFEAPSEVADVLADTLASALSHEGGWYADFSVGGDHAVIFAGRVFRYRKGDSAGRAAAQEYGRAVGVPAHQLDWPD